MKLLNKIEQFAKDYKDIHSAEPKFALCSVSYFDEPHVSLHQVIALTEEISEGELDEEIFYYTSGIEGLKQLTQKENCDDFIISDIYDMY